MIHFNIILPYNFWASKRFLPTRISLHYYVCIYCFTESQVQPSPPSFVCPHNTRHNVCCVL